MKAKNYKLISVSLSVTVSFLFVFAFATSTTTINSSGITATGSGAFATIAVTSTSTLAGVTISGNVGIGTTSPSVKLEVVGSTDATQFIVRANSTQSNSNPLIKVIKNDGEELTRIHSDDYTNLFIGQNSGQVNIPISGDYSGTYNTFIGSNTGRANTTGDSNTAVGSINQYFNTTGRNNTSMGYAAVYENTTGSGNTGLGAYSLMRNTIGTQNTAVGYWSLIQNTTGDYNTGVGTYALRWNTTGHDNISIGTQNLFSNTTGNYNVAMGNYALYYNVSATNTTAIGYMAGLGVPGYSNQNNSLFGYKAGYGLSTGNNNLFLGYQAGDSITTGSDNIIIGYDVDATSTDSTNFLNIGNTIYGNLANGSVGIGTTSPYAKLSIESTTGGTAPLFVIASSTAGAGTSTMFYVGANGNVGIGTSSPQRRLHVFKEGSTDTALIVNELVNDSNTAGPALNFWRSRGTASAKTVPNSGDILGYAFFEAWDGSGYQTAASIRAALDGAGGSGDTPGRLAFHTTPDGSASEIERMRITSTGNVGLATTTPLARLTVGSSTPIYLTSDQYYNSTYISGQLEVGGSATSTFAGYIDVKGAATATSTFTGNVRVLGTLQSGDLAFANAFRFTEDPMPINGTLQEGTQSLKLKNQRGEDILTIDENGNLTIAGNLTTPTSSGVGAPTEASEFTSELLSNVFGSILDWLSDKIMNLKKLIVSEEVCVEDVCLNKSDFRGIRELLNQHGLKSLESADQGSSPSERQSQSEHQPEVATTSPEELTIFVSPDSELESAAQGSVLTENQGVI